MNLILKARDIVRGVSAALVDDLDSLVVRINQVWREEHDAATGAHTTITPTALTWRGTTQTTVGAAGGASALPATPTGYLLITIGSTQYVVPYYAQS